MTNKLKKSLIIESACSVQSPDNVGEILELDGADTSQLNGGQLNADHRKGFAHLLGRIIDHKKIRSENDCETAFQRKEWQRLQRPYLWTRAELFDGFGHKEADSVAAIYRYYMDKNLPVPVKTSVEGKILERQGKRLMRTSIRGVALTIQPCHTQTSTEVVDVLKSQNVSQDTIDQLLKSQDSSVPIFTEVEPDTMTKVHALACLALQILSSTKTDRKN